jgi:hypothetical protein
VFKPETIAYTVEKAAEIVERELKKNPDKPRELEAEARKLRKELARFLQLIGEGKAPDAVLLEIRRREDRLKVIERERAALVEAPPTWSVAQIRVMCGERLRRFPELLHGAVPVANQAIGKLLVEPFTFYPHTTADGTRTLGFKAITTLGPLFDPAHKALVSPRGTNGDCCDYLFDTVDHLRELGIRDRRIEALERRVRELRPDGTSASPSATIDVLDQTT